MSVGKLFRPTFASFIIIASTNAFASLWIFDAAEMVVNKDKPVNLKSFAKGDGCVEFKATDNPIAFKKAIEKEWPQLRWSLDTSGEIPTLLGYSGKMPIKIYSIASSQADCYVASAAMALQAGIDAKKLAKYK